MARNAHARKDVASSGEINLSAIAGECLRRADDYEAAAVALLAEARTDAEIYAKLLGPYEMRAALDAVRKAASAARDRVWNAPVVMLERPAESAGRLDALVRMNSAMLLDFVLPGGKRLAEATTEDLRGAATFYGKLANDMAWKSRWLDRIAGGLPQGKVVAEVFDEAALAALKEGAAQC